MELNRGISHLLLFLIVAAFIITPLADFVSVWARSNATSQSRLGGIWRLACISLIILYFLSLNVSITKRSFNLFLLAVFGFLNLFLFSFYLMSQNVILVEGEFSTKGLIENVVLMFKFFVIFFYVAFFSYVHNRDTKVYLLLKKVICWVTLLYFVAVIIGGLFQLELFKYYDTARWGYKGIAVAGNELSGLVLAAAGLTLLLPKNKTRGIIFFFVLLTALFSGTKAAVFGVVMLYSIFILKSMPLTSIVFIFSFVTLMIISVYTYIVNNDSLYTIAIGSIDYFEYQLENNAQGSFLTLLLSGRDMKLQTVMQYLLDNNILVLLLGGYPISTYSVEMDIFDLVLMFGLFGASLYTYYFVKLWFNSEIREENRFERTLFFLTLFAVSCLGGHIIYSALAAPLLALLSVEFTRTKYDR